MIRFLCTAALLAATAAAQSTDLTFEVASIKPSGGTPGDIKIVPARIEIPYWSTKQLITRAYGVWPGESQFAMDRSAKVPTQRTRIPKPRRNSTWF